MIICLAACQKTTRGGQSSLKIAPESPVRDIPLIGDVSQSRAEISGMAWCDEHLILLPQYPGRFGVDTLGGVFSIPRGEIEAALSGESSAPIKPALILFDQAGLESSIEGFEGFEGIAVIGDRFYVTIEARQVGGMMGYLAMGQVNGECTSFVVDASSLVPIQPQAELGNMSDETIILQNDAVYTLYEANGLNINPNAVAHVFDQDLNSRSTLSMANVEYRITDATTVDDAGIFWGINYFYPGDTKLNPAPDPIAQEYGLGASHQSAEQVERLLAFEINENSIDLSNRKPIYFELSGSTARNWEGVVRLGDGFLLVTDEHPSTMMGYVNGLIND